MTRYYYTDPLAAAWMAAKFGMAFYNERRISRIRCDFEIYSMMRLVDEAPFYISERSLHLLEPQVGDMISHLGLRAWRIDAMDSHSYLHPAMPNESLTRFTLKAENPQIIQRNGIAFHWPEVEP